MGSDAFGSAIGNIVYPVYLLLAVYVYVSLIRQISHRPDHSADGPAKGFALPEVIVAALLVSWFLLNVAAAVARPEPALRTRDVIVTVIFTVLVVIVLVGFLRWRGIDIDVLGGFSKMGFVRVVSTGAILLFFAYPLINLADIITQRTLGSGSSRQSIVELFNGSQTIQQRITIIVLAVAVAPIAEEFVFRFFLYGVLRRYFGRLAGLIISALLFAAVHAHLPSFAPLFVLAACFTLAYEWSGSILVAMTMHCLFNSLTLTALAFPQLSEP
jgi:membrane protease YdiL (CAAX protease family)